jgi:hypothetical protein
MSENVREYLKRKLIDCQTKLKKIKRKRKIIQVTGAVIIVLSITTSVLVASVALPVIAVTVLSITSGILTGVSVKFNFQHKKHEISHLIDKLNKIQIKLDYVLSCNGNLTIEEYQQIIQDFNGC